MASLSQLLEAAKGSAIFKRAKYLAAADLDFRRDLVAWRDRRGLNQKQVADRMGVSQQMVSKFESYEGDPRLSTIRRYAGALELVVTHSVQDDMHQQVSAPEDSWANGGAMHVHYRTFNSQAPQSGAARVISGYANAKRTDFALGA